MKMTKPKNTTWAKFIDEWQMVMRMYAGPDWEACDLRPALTNSDGTPTSSCMNMNSDGYKLTFVSTDGHTRLAVRTYSEMNSAMVVEVWKWRVQLSSGEFEEEDVVWRMPRHQKQSRGGKRTTTDCSRVHDTWQVKVDRNDTPFDVASKIAAMLAGQPQDRLAEQAKWTKTKAEFSAHMTEARTVLNSLGFTKKAGGSLSYNAPIPHFVVHLDDQKPSEVRLSFAPRAIPAAALVTLMPQIAELSMAISALEEKP
jgi:hypothetical protein